MRNGQSFALAITGALLVTYLLGSSAQAQSTKYQLPPAPIQQILDTPPTPTVSVNPTHTTMALFGRANLPTIAEFAEGELHLAGFRINPRNNSVANSRVAWLNALSFEDIKTGAVRKVALPDKHFFLPRWSPDGQRLAFVVDAPNGVELWIAEVATAQARRIAAGVNAVTGDAFEWLPNSKQLLVWLVPSDRGPAPNTKLSPTGPIIQEAAGRAAPAPTFEDLLHNEVDAALFTHYFTTQLALVEVSGGKHAMVGTSAVMLDAHVSPDGRYVLQNKAKRPYSYAVPAELFAADVIVTDLRGSLMHTVADQPLRDNVSPRNDSVAPGPRSVHWRSDQPATLVWVEAQDGGDVTRAATVRDRVFLSDAPFKEKRTLIDLSERYAGVLWGRDDYALVISRWRNTRHETRFAVDPSKPASAHKIFERNSQDRYNDPGMPVLRTLASGHAVMQLTRDGGAVFVAGAGSTRAGEYPFLAKMDLQSGKQEIVWRAQAPYHESVVALLDQEGRSFLTRRESRLDPPNYFVHGESSGDRQLTQFPDPAPQFAGVTKRLLTYRRADGVELSGTLYLPAGYDAARDGRLPLLMWAYPTEFTDAAVAGQVIDTQNRFVRPNGFSHLFVLTQGYAVLDDPKMAIIGANGAEPNDTYIEQLVASAKAAVDAVVELGVADRNRIAIGGHSYGAFMTANLLAHSDLFRAGIARSGAYNRTLTPFGFQAEQRNYWEAIDTYTRMSPFTYAGNIKQPILLIHGEADDNTGTFPIQSERFYAALKGLGATVRYVVLPLEAHGYRARESVMHTQWEMIQWLDRYVKPKAGGVEGTGREQSTSGLVH